MEQELQNFLDKRIKHYVDSDEICRKNHTLEQIDIIIDLKTKVSRHYAEATNLLSLKAESI